MRRTLGIALGIVLIQALLVPLFAAPAAKLAGLLGYGLLAGAGTALVLRDCLGVLGGDYLPVAAVIALLALAVSAGVAGLGRLLGRAGLGLGALVAFLAGNALSAAGSAPQ